METNGHGGILPVFGGRQMFVDNIEIESGEKTISGNLPLTFEGKTQAALTNYKLFGADIDNPAYIYNTGNNSRIEFNSIEQNIGITPSYALCDSSEYIDYASQKINVIGNWLDNEKLVQGYYATPSLAFTSDSRMVSTVEAIHLPNTYNSDFSLNLYTDLSGIVVQTIRFSSSVISAATKIDSDYSFAGGFPMDMHDNNFVLLRFRKNDWSDLSVNSLVGHVWIASGANAGYKNYKELVEYSITLPELIAVSGTNTFGYTGSGTIYSEVTGAIS